jgi:hypothetical protein
VDLDTNLSPLEYSSRLVFYYLDVKRARVKAKLLCCKFNRFSLSLTFKFIYHLDLSSLKVSNHFFFEVDFELFVLPDVRES